MSDVAIHRLTLETASGVLLALDDILAAARGDLVGPKARLDSAQERAMDAEHGRILLWAALEGQPVGLVDAVCHHPGPGDLTYAQIAVAGHVRFRGVARTLVRAAQQEARHQDLEPEDLYAAALPWAHGAHAFWASLGFEPSPRWPELLWARARSLT